MSTAKVETLPFWARFVSTVFHPFVMPTVTLVLLFLSDGYLHSMPHVFVYMLVVVLVNTVAPALSLYLLYRRGHLSDLEIRSRGERTLPFVIVLAYFALTYILLITSPALYVPFVYLDMWMGLMASLAIALVITRWFKISMHMLGQGGALGSVMGLAGLAIGSQLGAQRNSSAHRRNRRFCPNRIGGAPARGSLLWLPAGLHGLLPFRRARIGGLSSR